MATNKETTTNFCGDCQRFDIKDCSGRLVGNTNLKEGLVRNGLCRGSKEFNLGVVNDKTACRQPPGVFKPIEVENKVSY